jgi:predicted dehydrogenase
MIKYTNNIACNMWFSKSAIGKRNGMKVRIFGDEGAASWNQENPEILEFSDKFGNHSIIDRANTQVTVCNLPRYNRFKPGHPAGFIEAFANYYDDVAISLRNFKTNQTDYLNEDCFGLTEALEGLQLLEAVTRSGETLKWEKVLS